MKTIKQRAAEVTKELTELKNRRLEILGQLPTPTGTTTGKPSGAKSEPVTAKLEARIPVSVVPVFGPIDDAALERIEVDLAKALEKAQGRFKVFGNQTKLAEEKLAAFERAIDSLIAGGALESSPELIETLRIQIDVLRFSLEKTGDKTEEVFEGMAGEAKILERVFEGVFDSIDKALDSTVEGVLLGTRSMSSAFQDLARNVILSIQKMLIQMAVIDPLQNVLRGFIGGLLGIRVPVASVSPSLAGTPLGAGSVPISRLAHGGLITSPTLALIGEREPEAVIPLSNLRDDGVIGERETIVVNQHFHLSIGVPEAVRREVNNMRPLLKKDAIEAITEARNRGGSFTKLIGERSKGSWHLALKDKSGSLPNFISSGMSLIERLINN